IQSPDKGCQRHRFPARPTAFERLAVDAVEKITTRRLHVEAADDAHQRALTRTRRAHDRHEVALQDRQADTAKGMDGGIALAVGLCQLPDPNDRRRLGPTSWQSLGFAHPLPPPMAIPPPPKPPAGPPPKPPVPLRV